MTWVHAPGPKADLRASQEAHARALRKLGPLPKLPSTEDMLRLYETMMRIRAFEDRAWKAAREGEGLPIHPSAGHEAVAVGVCSLLTKRDKVVSNHRPFGHFIAKGGSLRALMAELFGKATGVCKGLGGEMFLSEPSIGFVLSSMMVGSCMTLATGVGLALKMGNSKSVAACFFGDAASTNGAFHEALTMASIYEVPLLFVCENNGYSTNSPAMEYMPTGMVVDRARGYGFPAVAVDGTDVLAVREAAQRALWHIAHNRTPYFIEALVSRIGPHKQILVDSRDEDRKTYARMRDPIVKFRGSLIAEGILTAGQDASIRRSLDKEVANAVGFARRGASLPESDLYKYLYVNP
jgi:acetoin:2,6-dichlorophenolindophenol oxidoreductase subunit alpha